LTEGARVEIYGRPCEINLSRQGRPGVTILAGENGVGKTTLLKKLAGSRSIVPEAVRLVEGTLPDVLARLQGAEQDTKACIVDDPRTQFLGFTCQDELLLLYMNSKCVKRAAGFIPARLLRKSFDELSYGEMKTCNALTGLEREASIVALDDLDSSLSTDRLEPLLQLFQYTSAVNAVIVSTHEPQLYDRLDPSVMTLSAGEDSIHEAAIEEVAQRVLDLVAARPTRHAVVTGSGLMYRYPSGEEALKNVSFAFDSARRQAYLVRGENGSGKTTLLRVLGGLIRKSGGKLAWRPRRRRVAYAPQRPSSLFFEDRLREECSAWGLSVEQDVELEHLSAGQAKMLSVLLVSAADAGAYLLDEPYAGLSERNRATLSAVVAGLASRRLVIETAHSIEGASDGAVLTL
jgi:energy-coupling factor transport system ATP-binding protein